MRGQRLPGCRQTLDLVVDRLAERLGIDGYLASALVVEDECCRPAYSGEVLEGRHKWAALKSFADLRFGPQGWHLAVAYGDSPSDIPLLERAEEPVAVNARPALFEIARRRGWRQVTWR
jgi:phosphoserine phosphatase